MIETVEPDTLLSSYEVGWLIQASPSSVNTWVKRGLLPAHRTPGGHRRIRAADVVAFLDAHKMPVPKALDGARACAICAGTGEVLAELSPGVRTVAKCSCVKEERHGK